MVRSFSWQRIRLGDLGVLTMLAAVVVCIHVLLDGQYGFHRDELATIDDARYLDWGYVAYPPLTPFIARVALELFGPSLAGIRMFSAIAQAVAMVLTGLMVRELGGGRVTQVVAALVVATSLGSMILSSTFMYVSFDYMWWVLIAYFVVRLLKSEDPRWWLGIGAAIGMGMMTKYTMAFWVAALVGGVVLTSARRYLRSRWLWGGVGLSLLIFLPNLIWQLQHGFISLEFLASIHARDVRIGRTDDFLIEQLALSANLPTVPFWIAGLYFFAFSPSGRRYRIFAWMFAITFLLLLVLQGRSYYLSPAYPMLIAGGVVAGEKWAARGGLLKARFLRGYTWVALLLSAIFGAAIMMPIAPINTQLWDTTSKAHDIFTEQIGWPELAQTVAGIYATIPPEERSSTGILAGNYGEAGAINLYGRSLGLPEAISGTNSYWLRGYGNPPPERLILVGFSRARAELLFEGCELAGRNTNPYGVVNEESKYHPDIFLCRAPLQPWPEFWRIIRNFG